jgi:quercetin dioxygenase-like cupin family protein
MNGEGVDTPLRGRRISREASLLKPLRCIVTGYDEQNRAVIVSDGVPPRVPTLPGNGPTIYEIWSTQQFPARLNRANARMRVLDVLPEGPNAHQAHMHRTESIDYGIVLQGEMTLILEEGETLVRAGDIVVQRGTNHAWANRSGRLCRIALIGVDAAFEDELK